MKPDPKAALSLWSDDPSATDLLAFDAVASTVADALLDDVLDPVALGLSGPWGSGKTTVLGLVEAALNDRASDKEQVLVIKTDPWRYDPTTGAKESLIGEVLASLADEIEQSEPASEDAKKKARALAGRLVKRVDWAKAIKLTAKTSLAFQIPSVNEIVDLVKPAGGDEQEDEQVRGLEEFRGEFKELLESEALKHVKTVAVLVDDLDRCLPETVIETLEAIRLFLAVPKMSFVIAADEDRVADAIRTRFRDTGSDATSGGEGEEPAKLYLHKIVQTTFPLPALSRFDTQAYLLLLQLQQTLGQTEFETLIEQCAEIRRSGGGLDDLTELEGVDFSEDLAFASRLTPILYEKLRGNPRRIKRFLNDLRVRQSVASRRGIDLDAAVVAKLMVLEKLLDDEFKKLLDWLATGALRDELVKLEAAAGKPAADAAPEEPGDGKATKREARNRGRTDPGNGSDESGKFSEAMLRWAKLPPAVSGIDLSPYLYLAATFTGEALLDESLPERLRDVAANLLSSSRTDRQAVTDADIAGLDPAETEALLLHLGRTVRDQPSTQKTGVTGILRIGRSHPESAGIAKQALLMLPVEEVSAATPLLVDSNDPPEIFEVLEKWKQATSREQLATAIDRAIEQRPS
jgi:hypothetical protein